MNLSTSSDGTGQLAVTRDASRSGRRQWKETVASICREAGARVKFNALLRERNVGVRATDNLKIEVLAQELPFFGGAHLAIDVTLRSAVGRNGEARPNAAEVDGAVLLPARIDKETRYPELTTGRCRLVRVAIETGERWSEEAVDLLWQLSCAKARNRPSLYEAPTGSSLGTPLDQDAQYLLHAGINSVSC